MGVQNQCAEALRCGILGVNRAGNNRDSHQNGCYASHSHAYSPKMGPVQRTRTRCLIRHVAWIVIDLSNDAVGLMLRIARRR
jgi:hypothetical protein